MQWVSITTELERKRAHAWIDRAPPGTKIAFRKADTRSLDQNSLMWSLFHDISKQLVWYGERLSSEEVKDLLTAGLRKNRVVPGIDGGFVVLGQHTSTMSKNDLSQLIELAYAFGAQNGIKFHEQTDNNLQSFRVQYAARC